MWLCWIFSPGCGLSLVPVSGDHSSLQCVSFCLWWLLLLRTVGSAVAALRLSCPGVCGIFADQGRPLALASGFSTTGPPLSISPPQYLIWQNIWVILWSKQLFHAPFLFHASLRRSLSMLLYFCFPISEYCLFDLKKLEQRVSFFFWEAHQVSFQWLTCKI